MSAFRKIFRSTSLPETSDDDKENNNKWSKIAPRILSKSLPRIEDRSNSASPTRRQPHPFAMYAYSMRPGFGNRGARVFEWPPPDPPPLTPLNFGMTRQFVPAPPPNNPAIRTQRPWWRRNAPTRPNGPIIHVTIDTTDLANPIPATPTERPTRIPSTDNDDHETATITPQQTIGTETLGTQALNGARSSSAVVQPGENQPTRAQLRIHPGLQESVTAEHTANTQQNSDEPGVLTTMTSENEGMISLSSEEIQEESTFQIFFVVLDSNPTVHRDYRANDADIRLLPMTLELIRQQYARGLNVSPDEADEEEDASNNRG